MCASLESGKLDTAEGCQASKWVLGSIDKSCRRLCEEASIAQARGEAPESFWTGVSIKKIPGCSFAVNGMTLIEVMAPLQQLSGLPVKIKRC